MARAEYDITGNGNTIPFPDIFGGYLIVKISGTFDGAVVQPQADFLDGDYQPFLDPDNADQNLVAPGIKALQPLKKGMRLRFNTTNAGGSTNLTVKIL